ncbi:MAG: isochorismatase family protein [Candidatus Microsaccharimonas sp.]
MSEQLRNALVIVDTQRGFMPASEGERLGVEGFGELGVTGGERIVEHINDLTIALSRQAENLILTTQDWHPQHTAHFAQPEAPNYVNTWPVHCVGDTPGAELHPDLLVAQQPELATRFIKGDKACTSPEDDDSYTGALAYNPITDVLLPDWLREMRANKVYVAGLALGDGNEHPLCVDSTARDLHEQGFDVTLITDAAEAVMPENRELCFRNLGNKGITLLTTEQALAEINAGI